MYQFRRILRCFCILCFSSIRIQNALAFGQKQTTITATITSTALHEAPVRFAGTGARQVDMNQYNLPVQDIEGQWKANIFPKTVDDDGGIRLGCENARDYFVDNISVVLPQRPPPGVSWGIELQEIAGGREDGLGITLVSRIVPGGYIDSCNVDIIPGDSISSIVSSTANSSPGSGSMMSDSKDIRSISTECLGYDKTVSAFAALSNSDNDISQESIVMNLKRLRRKPVIKVNLKYPPSQKEKDKTIELFAGENLRLGCMARGVSLNDEGAKRFDTKSGGNCGAGGLCRTCSVSILRGGELLNPAKMAEKQMMEDNPRWRLGCKAFVGYGMMEGEITVQVKPSQW